MNINDAFIEAGETLSASARQAFYAALVEYLSVGREPSLSGPALSVFTAIRPELDKSRARSEAGRKGGRPRKQSGNQTKKQTESKTETKTESKPESKASAPSITSNVTGINTYPVSTTGKEEEKKSIKEKNKKFSPPSLQEVRDFCREKGYTFDPDSFHAYYESNGWRVGRNPMKSWKAACVTWQRNERPRQQQAREFYDCEGW